MALIHMSGNPKKAERDKLNKLVEEFVLAGGVIKQIPMGVSGKPEQVSRTTRKLLNKTTQTDIQ